MKQITDLTAITTLADADQFLVRQDSTGVDRRVSAQSLRRSVTVEDIAALKASPSPQDGDGAVVADEARGGVFVFRSALTAAADGGTTFKADDATAGSWLRQFSGPVNVRWFGAVGDGFANDATAVQSAINCLESIGGGVLRVPAGTYLISSEISCLYASNPVITIAGDSRGASIFQTASNIVVFRIRESVRFSDLTVRQTGAAKTGTAFSTTTTQQIQRSSFQRVTVQGFKYGWWVRFSLWCAWRDIRTIDCAVGIKFSRNADPDDQTNPLSSIGWNSEGGFFHNVNTLDNCLFRGGEIGLWGTLSGCSLTGVTCEQQTSVDGSGNVAAPAGLPGTGLYLQNGRATAPFTGSSSNTINSFYAEYTRQPMAFENCRVSLGAYYAQGGGSSGAAYPQVIKAIGAVVDARAAAGRWAIDWFSNRLVAESGALVMGDVDVGSVTGGGSDISADSQWFNANGSGAVENFEADITGTGSVNLVTMEDGSHYQVNVGYLRDGTSVRSAIFNVFYWNNAGGMRVIADADNSADIAISRDTTLMKLDLTESLQKLVRVSVVKLRRLGKTRANGTYSG
jgi:hypothetical protein